MEIMGGKLGFTEEAVNVVKNVGKLYCVKKYVVGARTGVLIAKNN